MDHSRYRKPERIPLLFIIAATALLVTLGVWQLERLAWKKALIAQVESAEAQPALGTLPESDAEIAALDYRNAVLTGRFIAEKRLRFIGRESRGYVWYVPFKLEDSDRVVLASLDWLPADMEPQLAAGVQQLKGTLRAPRAKRLFSPGNHPEKNLWFTEDMAELAQATGQRLAPIVLDTTGKPVLRNDHLGYAVTWFLLALIGIFMFILYHRRPEVR